MRLTPNQRLHNVFKPRLICQEGQAVSIGTDGAREAPLRRNLEAYQTKSGSLTLSACLPILNKHLSRRGEAGLHVTVLSARTS